MSNTSTRKIVAGSVILAVGLAVTFIKGDIPPNLDNLLQILYGAFVLGNAFEHFTNMKQTQATEEKKEVKE